MFYKLGAETPAKKNSRITLRNGRTIPSKRFMLWHEIAMGELIPQKRPSLPIEYPVEISITFVHGDLRRRDSDNGCSSIMDLLVDSDILSDDNWQIVRKINIENDYEKGNPHCLIEIKPLRED